MLPDTPLEGAHRAAEMAAQGLHGARNPLARADDPDHQPASASPRRGRTNSTPPRSSPAPTRRSTAPSATAATAFASRTTRPPRRRGLAITGPIYNPRVSTRPEPAGEPPALAYAAWVAICVIWGTTYLGIRICLETMPPGADGRPPLARGRLPPDAGPAPARPAAAQPALLARPRPDRRPLHRRRQRAGGVGRAVGAERPDRGAAGQLAVLDGRHRSG